jgi:hypothetical protein
LVGGIVGCGLYVAVGVGVSVIVGAGVGLGGPEVAVDGSVGVGVVVGNGELVGLGVLVKVDSTATTAVPVGAKPREEAWSGGVLNKKNPPRPVSTVRAQPKTTTNKIGSAINHLFFIQSIINCQNKIG